MSKNDNHVKAEMHFLDVFTSEKRARRTEETNREEPLRQMKDIQVMETVLCHRRLKMTTWPSVASLASTNVSL